MLFSTLTDYGLNLVWFLSHFQSVQPHAVFLNAPHILLPAEMFGSPTRFDSVSQGEVPSEADTQADPNLALRAWWKKTKDATEAKGLKESVMYLRDVLREGRYDVGVSLDFWCCGGLGC